jgi:hypothetical protein
MTSMTTAPTDETRETLGPEEGGGPPLLTPWTLVVDGEGWSADLEHGAPLPRVGERIEFIADNGEQRRFVVRDVVHTVQSAPGERPLVREEQRGPNSTVDRATDDPPHGLRAGLPRVIVEDDG